MKSANKFSRAYVFERVRPGVIIELLGLFKVENVFMEIFNIEKDSAFYKSIKDREDEYVLLSKHSLKSYASIFITENFREEKIGILEEIIDSRPEILTFYLTDLPLEDFLCLCRGRKNFDDKIIETKIAACVFEIMFDENTFSVTLDKELLRRSDLMPKIDEILIKN